MAYYPISTEISAVYQLVNNSGWRAVFNDPSDLDYVGPLTDVTGLDSSDVRESGADLIETDGGVHGAFYLGRRPIVLTGTVINAGSLLERRTKIDKARNASLALRSDSSLIWKPSGRQDNYAPNPSFEVDATTGIATNTPVFLNGGATVTQTTAQHNFGSAAAQLATTGASAYQGFTETLGILTPGTYNASMYVKGASGGELVQIIAGPATGATTANITATTGWQRINTNFVSDGINTNYVGLRTQGTTSALTVFIDGVQVTLGSSPIAYFDGDTAGYYWQGNAGQTRSGDYVELYVPVRRQQPFRETGQGWVKDFQIPLVSQYATIFSSSVKTASAPAGTPLVIENRGNYPAFPILQITGASGSNTVVTDGHGGTFRTIDGFSLSSTGPEIVWFDTLNHTGVFKQGARNNQVATRYIDFTNTIWPTLVSGNNTFTLAGGSGGTLTVSWRDAWA